MTQVATRTSVVVEPRPTQIKETITSIIIAFAMAFVFRGFVIEAFVIPTGSMAPTLLGAHMVFKSPYSGYEWTAGPRDMDPSGQMPLSVQRGINVRDPMTGLPLVRRDVPRSWGDRIFVMKYLYSVYDPKRWDVVVFKNPTDPGINYIKRLIGLPNEMIALIDGDVFVLPVAPGEAVNEEERLWGGDRWRAARKPEAAQRAMWQPVFSSEYTPIGAPTGFVVPWVEPREHMAQWKIADRKDYEYTGAGPTSLTWHPGRAITDNVAYNETHPGTPAIFPTSDIRMSLGIRPSSEGQRVAAVVNARGHEFRAEVTGTDVSLQMRRADGVSPNGEWQDLATAKLERPLRAGAVTNLDFWHVDQSMSLFVNDERVAYAEYDWSPGERVQWSLGKSLERIRGAHFDLTNPANYKQAGAHFEFSGGAFTLYRVGLGRDIFYQPGVFGQNSGREGQIGRAVAPQTTMVLNKDQFFTCGDNSPMSLDARLWGPNNPWVSEIDPQTGVVHRDLLIGKAFLVYFPAPKKSPTQLPIPDFGAMRFIW